MYEIALATYTICLVTMFVLHIKKAVESNVSRQPLLL